MQDFEGIAEKLVRAEENLVNLDGEIADFFQKGDYPVLPEHDNELLLKAIKYIGIVRSHRDSGCSLAKSFIIFGRASTISSGISPSGLQTKTPG
jgi:hypothetical protein